MKTKFKHIVPLVIITPFLMANSPAPMPSNDTYKDIDVSCAFVEKNALEGWCTYDMTITNTGEYYAQLGNHSYFRLNDDTVYMSFEYETLLFYDEVLPPGCTKTYRITTYRELELNPDTDVWATSASLIRDDNVTFSAPSITKEFDYYYAIRVNVEGRSDYYYNAIFDITYEGERYAFEVDIDQRQPYHISTAEKALNLDELTINKITAYRSSYTTYKTSPLLKFVAFIPFIILGILLLGVVAGIAIPLGIMAHRRKKYSQISR